MPVAFPPTTKITQQASASASVPPREPRTLTTMTKPFASPPTAVAFPPTTEITGEPPSAMILPRASNSAGPGINLSTQSAYVVIPDHGFVKDYKCFFRRAGTAFRR
ncbi:hypothetical protein BKA81DRAFT_376535 [Phyllosticta paracitricarpa]